MLPVEKAAFFFFCCCSFFFFHFKAVPRSDGVEWQTSIHPSSLLISHSGSHGCWSVPAGARHWSDTNGRWDYWAVPIPAMSGERRGYPAGSSSHGQHSHLCATESCRSARFLNRFFDFYISVFMRVFHWYKKEKLFFSQKNSDR